MLLGSLLLTAIASACMSNAACERREVSMCCYMNECVPSSNIGCSDKRFAFHEYLASLKTNYKRTEFTNLLRMESPKVAECDNAGVYCIDFVTTAVSDPGVFENISGTGELLDISLDKVIQDPSLLMGS